MHNFEKSLKWSHEQDEQPFWESVYRNAFGSEFVAFHNCRQDGDAQRAGIDRVVVLKSTQTLKIDEKVRRTNYPDILLEIWSDRDRKKPGWAHREKRLLCDYIAYAIVPTQTCYLLPYQSLRTALSRNARDWKTLADSELDGFRWVDAENPTYFTRSLAVPTEVLLDSFRDSLTVTWRRS